MDNDYIILSKSILFQGIDTAEMASILSCLNANKTNYLKNDYILRIGDTPKNVGLILSGSVNIIQDDFWGNRNIIAQLSVGQTFAETFACAPNVKMNVSVLANDNCQIMWLDAQRIFCACKHACLHHNHLIRNIASDLAHKNLLNQEKISFLSKRSTREKLLAYLSAEALKQGKIKFDTPFNRQQLADFLSVERSAMSSELAKMQRDKLITYQKNTFCLLHKI